MFIVENPQPNKVTNDVTASIEAIVNKKSHFTCVCIPKYSIGKRSWEKLKVSYKVANLKRE